jgi:hypothetical protein
VEPHLGLIEEGLEALNLDSLQLEQIAMPLPYSILGGM